MTLIEAYRSGGGLTRRSASPPSRRADDRRVWPRFVIGDRFFEPPGDFSYKIIDLRDPAISASDFDRHMKAMATFYRIGFNETGKKSGVTTAWPDDARVEAMIRHRLQIPGVAFFICPEGRESEIHGAFLMEHELSLQPSPAQQLGLVVKAVELDVLIAPELQGQRQGLGSKITLFGLNAMVEHVQKNYRTTIYEMDAITYVQDFQNFWWGRLGFKEGVLYGAEISREADPGHVEEIADLTIRRAEAGDAVALSAFLQTRNVVASIRGEWRPARADEYAKLACEGGEHGLSYLAHDRDGQIVGFCSAKGVIRRQGTALRDVFCAIRSSMNQSGLESGYIETAKRRQHALVNQLLRNVANAAANDIERFGTLAGHVELEGDPSILNFFAKFFDFKRDTHYLKIDTSDLGTVGGELLNKVRSSHVVILRNAPTLSSDARPAKVICDGAVADETPTTAGMPHIPGGVQAANFN